MSNNAAVSSHPERICNLQVNPRHLLLTKQKINMLVEPGKLVPGFKVNTILSYAVAGYQLSVR